tara:strand:- start:92 stop:1195 length:1104 start_codon:yes stop_codon:yes gene_type:complete
MTIQEMHIAVNLGVQKIASFQTDNLLSQEIDHELNTAMDKFIKQRYYPMGNKYQKGFEQSQKRIDDLRNLTVNSRLTSYFHRESVGNGEFFIERASLPQDYLFLVNGLTEIRYKCGGAIVPSTTTNTKVYFSISLAPPISGYVLKTIRYFDPSTPANIGGDFIHNSEGMDYDYYSNANNYSVGVVPADSRQDIGVSSNTEGTPTVDSNTLLLSIPSTTYVANGWVAIWGDLLTGAETSVSYSGPTSQTLTKRDAPTIAIKRVPIKYVQHDDILALLLDPFNTTTHKYPKYTIQENFVDIYSDNSFIPIFVELTYIRHPKRLTLSQGVGCELPEHTHQEIVELGIKSILETIESPRYTSQSREVLESE